MPLTAPRALTTEALAGVDSGRRDDVEGLRALAVLSVLFYHARLGLVAGGYVGVDVFFVISGYLITRLVVRDLDARRFSYGGFLLRRARRLLPAMVVVAVAGTLAALVLLGPFDLSAFALSVLAALGLSANLYFWSQQGYFTAGLPEQPLLHTWSLSLEEQYYLLFPLLLIAIKSCSARRRQAILWILTAGGLAFSLWLTGLHPGAAFYLVIARAWEFLLGGAVGLGGAPRAPRLAKAVSVVSLAVLVLAFLGLVPPVPYPGTAALLPATAAAGLLWSGAARTVTPGRWLLSLPLLVSIGSVSYSLYLWHWPLLTLARYSAGRELGVPEAVAVLALTGLLATWSYWQVERPWRAEASGRPPRSLLPVGVLGGLLGVAAVLIVLGHGYPGRLPGAAVRFDSARFAVPTAQSGCHHGPPERVTGDPLCRLTAGGTGPAGGDAVLVWGDSHANAVGPVLQHLGDDYGVPVYQASYSSCPPLAGVRVGHTSLSHHCREFNAAVLRSMAAHRVSRVLLAGYWTTYLPTPADNTLVRWLNPYDGHDAVAAGTAEENDRLFRASLAATLSALRDQHVQVWLLAQVPDQKSFVPLALSHAVRKGADPRDVAIGRDAHRSDQAAVMAALADFAAGFTLIDPAVLLCQSGRCITTDGVDSFYVDSNHLSVLGATSLAGLLAPLIAPSGVDGHGSR